MFFRILVKDLKRKKTMNVILLLFIILAAMFLAGSVDNLIAVNGAIDHFLSLSNMPDFFNIALTDGETDEIADFIADCAFVSEYEIFDGFSLLDEDITITSCREEPARTRYERSNILGLGCVPEKFMKVFDEDDRPLSLKPGEIAFPQYEAQLNHLQDGDRVRIRVGEVEQDFTVAAIVKDAAFGTPMMGFKRLFVSAEDFARYAVQTGQTHVRIYSVDYTDRQAFRRAWKDGNFMVISNVEDGSVIRMCYIMDMLISAVLIVVSVCLILIAFLVLRFTIVFTLQEDYREIGIMKAIGIRDRGIKGLYLVKYLALSVIGSVIGLLLSIPFGKELLDRTVVYIVVEQSYQNRMVNVACAAGVVLVVMTFCYVSTGRLEKISVMEAVRCGLTGERFHAKERLKLRKRMHMRPYFYLALNDIVSSLKRYGVLFAIFCLGTMLILLPLSASSTLKSESIIDMFGMSPSDAYLDTGKAEIYTADMDCMLRDMEDIEAKLEEAGLQGWTGVDMGYIISCYAHDPEDTVNYFILQEMGSWERSYTVVTGREPEFANEIMITEMTAEELQVGIGDTIYFQTADSTDEYVITGTYQSMMNMGKGYRVSRSARLDPVYASGILCIQVEIEGMESKEACEKLASLFPDYEVMGTQDFLNDMIGGIIGQLDALMAAIVSIVLVINSLITILIMKTIMTREHGDIALLKSIGFGDGTLRAWQTVRILLVLAAAVAAGTVLSNLLGPFLIGPIFGMMGGTSVELVTNTFEACVVYPLLLFGVTGISALLCAGGVKKVAPGEVNTGE